MGNPSNVGHARLKRAETTSHAWGMFDKRRLESGTAIARVWWVEALYWGCWAVLAALAVHVSLKRL